MGVYLVSWGNLDDPIVTVHQSIGEAKEQFYYERTVFLRCMANSNPPVRYSWRRGREFLSQGSDKGVEIYEPFFTQGETKILKLKNLRPQDYANYSCIASVRNSVTLGGVTLRGEPTPTLTWVRNRTSSPKKSLLNGGNPHAARHLHGGSRRLQLCGQQQTSATRLRSPLPSWFELYCIDSVL
ncbi:unnamed protein product [Coregonus sp. 'balchen']|nr:unnamed protein product [Coregonus sp. 'balchen']